MSSQGIAADPEKLRAKAHMPAPTEASEVNRFLGVISQLAKCMPILS